MATNCLTEEQLERLLNGQIVGAEQAELSSHLDVCESCQRSLESLVASNETWSLAAQRLADAKVAAFARTWGHDPALDVVIGRAKQLHREDGDSENAPVALDFLEASDKPDVLGKLGHYDILQVIGRGGMGVVLKAFDTSLRRVVAIKVMAPHLAANGSARSRFVREAIATAAVVHEHVVAIHAVAEKSQPPYLVMQFIEGKTLQDRLDRSGRLNLSEILRIGMQTAAGLAAAHAQGLVHRDIKPANILLENGVERVKLTDFGLARAVDDASVTQSGVITGTPQYMSPEQARGDTIDHRSDLFSLGSVLYAMCVGHTPFRAATTMGVLKRLCEEAPRPIQETNPEIPYWLSEIVDKLHAKSPSDRYQSATEVAAVLAGRLASLQQPVSMPQSNHSHAMQPAPIKAEPKNPLTEAPAVDLGMPFSRVPLISTVLFWCCWGILVSLLTVIGLADRAGFSRIPLLADLIVIGFALLVVVVVVQAYKYGGWRFTSLGPYPLLAVSITFGFPIAAFFFWFEQSSSQVKYELPPPAIYFPSTPEEPKSPHNPMNAAGSEALIKELRTLVEQSEQSLNISRALFEGGRITSREMLDANNDFLDAKIRLASAQNQPEKVLELLNESVKVHEELLQIFEKRYEQGVLSFDELARVRQQLTEARIRRETAKHAGKE